MAHTATHPYAIRHDAGRFFQRILAASVLAVCVALAFCVDWALAEDIDTDPEADELQQEVERTAAEYESALFQVEAAQNALVENRERLVELQESIPAQQKRSDAAARELYKIERQGSGIVEMLLSSSSFSDFLTNLEYVSRASEANIAEINRLHDMQSELEETQGALKQSKRDADAHAQEASDALDAAKAARQEAQRRAQEEAQRQAEAEAAARAEEAQGSEVDEQAEDGDVDDGGAESDRDADEPAPSDDSQGEGDGGVSDNGEGVETPSADGADWTSDQSAFVSEWAARIDAYLAGSPLAGQGQTFALAAWTYGVDPRWSPAISFTESSKGAACFAEHNAWGWGSESWSTWEEAINDHVRGLARGYGYTISIEAAQKYCPPNWQAWYDRTLEQMNLI